MGGLLVEINNGRLAMLGIMGFLAAGTVCGDGQLAFCGTDDQLAYGPDPADGSVKWPLPQRARTRRQWAAAPTPGRSEVVAVCIALCGTGMSRGHSALRIAKGRATIMGTGLHMLEICTVCAARKRATLWHGLI